MQRSIGLGGWDEASLTDGAGRRSLWRRRLAILVPAAILLSALAMTKLAMPPANGRAVDSATPWTAHIERMDGALARKDVSAAERAWHAAYLAALGARRWEGRLAVGDAYLRIGEAAKGSQTAAARARTNYMAALFLARQQGSLDGVLRVAEAFAALGDREVVEGCLRIADRLAIGGGDLRAPDRVRALRERRAARFAEAGSLS